MDVTVAGLGASMMNIGIPSNVHVVISNQCLEYEGDASIEYNREENYYKLYSISSLQPGITAFLHRTQRTHKYIRLTRSA
jgi:hypothetical protein